LLDVYFLIQPPSAGRFEGLEEALSETHFKVGIEERSDGLLGIWCYGIDVPGAASLPEALRIAQVGLSIPLKHTYPAYAEHGGLLWRDVLRAEVISQP
jgi:hypothetical protein